MRSRHVEVLRELLGNAMAEEDFARQKDWPERAAKHDRSVQALSAAIAALEDRESRVVKDHYDVQTLALASAQRRVEALETALREAGGTLRSIVHNQESTTWIRDYAKDRAAICEEVLNRSPLAFPSTCRGKLP